MEGLGQCVRQITYYFLVIPYTLLISLALPMSIISRASLLNLHKEKHIIIIIILCFHKSSPFHTERVEDLSIQRLKIRKKNIKDKLTTYDYPLLQIFEYMYIIERDKLSR